MKVICLNCAVEFEKATPEIARSPNHFCSRSCSASFHNRKHPKRAKEGNCVSCQLPIASKLRYCKKCYSKVGCRKKTIGEYREMLASRGKHRSWLHAQVRQFARAWNADLRKFPCQVCGYHKHVELAHIKPLSSFTDAAVLEDVNAPSNLLVLCPNHHWEFDAGLLTLDDVSPR